MSQMPKFIIKSHNTSALCPTSLWMLRLRRRYFRGPADISIWMSACRLRLGLSPSMLQHFPWLVSSHSTNSHFEIVHDHIRAGPAIASNPPSLGNLGSALMRNLKLTLSFQLNLFRPSNSTKKNCSLCLQRLPVVLRSPPPCMTASDCSRGKNIPLWDSQCSCPSIVRTILRPKPSSEPVVFLLTEMSPTLSSCHSFHFLSYFLITNVSALTFTHTIHWICSFLF